jgi:putative methionine-R-sulfoxide reductase with GAF domain
LLKFGAEVDCLDSYGGTPLVAAALNGEIECLEALIDASADVNHATTNLNTPLMKAALNGHVACVRILLGRGAEAAKVNNSGKTALGLAQHSMEKEIEKLKREEEARKRLKLPTGAPEEKLQEENNNPVTRAIKEKRTNETIRRLKKLIENHEQVIKDLDKTQQAIKSEYADLFEDTSTSPATYRLSSTGGT